MIQIINLLSTIVLFLFTFTVLYYLLISWYFVLTRYGTSTEQFARVAEKNHKHSVNNPYAQFQDAYSLEEILASKLICEPITVSTFLSLHKGV